ncbi:MAG: heme d1 biosynthesis radical SAM protein NirJ2, partial [Theionarchaea archaeon]|nr:heme d1 biosynthesis radical SAM protein NirJ2 [Theionarchaea archaeon]
YKWKCGGCRCVAYAYTGSVTGEDVMCPIYGTKGE